MNLCNELCSSLCPHTFQLTFFIPAIPAGLFLIKISRHHFVAQFSSDHNEIYSLVVPQFKLSILKLPYIVDYLIKGKIQCYYLINGNNPIAMF